eukprot:gene162-9362_t
MFCDIATETIRTSVGRSSSFTLMGQPHAPQVPSAPDTPMKWCPWRPPTG